MPSPRPCNSYVECDTLQDSVEVLRSLGDQYFLPEAIELLRRTRGKKRLSDDEILLLTVTAAQAVRAYYVEPEKHPAKEILETILSILDHEEVIRAEYNKLYSIFREEARQEGNMCVERNVAES
jgi:hypothetical protein